MRAAHADFLLFCLLGGMTVSAGIAVADTAQDQVLIQAIGFAVTGSDDAKVTTIDKEKCIFKIDGRFIIYFNNIQTDRITTQGYTQKTQWGNRVFAIVSIHGSQPVYEEIVQPLKELPTDNEGTKKILDHIRSQDPKAFTLHMNKFNEHNLEVDTGETKRLTRAWQYIYAHGCVGEKSPF